MEETVAAAEGSGNTPTGCIGIGEYLHSYPQTLNYLHFSPSSLQLDVYDPKISNNQKHLINYSINCEIGPSVSDLKN